MPFAFAITLASVTKPSFGPYSLFALMSSLTNSRPPPLEALVPGIIPLVLGGNHVCKTTDHGKGREISVAAP
jgi:hypothetical protein